MEGELTRNYTVTWCTELSANFQSKSGISRTSTTITGLKSNTAYLFKLTAVNEAGMGEASNITFVQTGNKKFYCQKFFFRWPIVMLP